MKLIAGKERVFVVGVCILVVTLVMIVVSWVGCSPCEFKWGWSLFAFVCFWVSLFLLGLSVSFGDGME